MIYRAMFAGLAGAPRIELFDKSESLEWLEGQARQVAENLSANYYWCGIINEAGEVVKEITFRRELGWNSK